MNKVVIVAHRDTKALFTATSDPDWYKCQLASEDYVVNNGVVTLQKRVAFPLISSKVVDILEKSLKDGSTFPIPGKIVRRVTLTPQFIDKNGNPQAKVINPKTGEELDYYSSYHFTTISNETDYDERVTGVAVEATAEQIPADQVV